MKVYSITSPDVLRQAAEGIKWDRDYRKAMAFADDWYRSGKDEIVYLEVSKNAHIFREEDGKKTLLATMYVAAAKDFVKGLTEV